MDLDATLDRLAADPFAPADLAALALHLAADEYRGLNVESYLARLDRYADELATRLAGSLPDRVAELTHLLFEQEGFAGNVADYYDPRNSYLSDVLDRKLGLPITLSVLAIGVGTRAGLNVAGVGLPGHFVAKAIAGDAEVIFDPFHGGQFLDRAGCQQLVEAVTGQPFDPTDDALAVTPPGFVARRLLTNLKSVYLRSGDYPRAARVTARLVQVAPDDPSQRRDLGVTLIHAGKPGKAIDHLAAYLATVPAAEDAEVVSEFLRDAQKEVARWN
jgi:regulator of sirC expression with transglutaminase-like and TPR domain